MGKTRQLEEFIEAYSERGFRFAYQLCRNAEEAKELVQEAFFRIIRNWNQYDSEGNLENWFLTILRHVYYDAAKRYESKNMRSLDSCVRDENHRLPPLSEAVADEREEPHLERLEREERAAKTQEILGSLLPEYRAVLTLCDMEGLGYEEIAVVLNCPLGTVRSRISRAREAFKKKFMESYREVLEP